MSERDRLAVEMMAADEKRARVSIEGPTLFYLFVHLDDGSALASKPEPVGGEGIANFKAGMEQLLSGSSNGHLTLDTSDGGFSVCPLRRVVSVELRKA